MGLRDLKRDFFTFYIGTLVTYARSNSGKIVSICINGIKCSLSYDEYKKSYKLIPDAPADKKDLDALGSGMFELVGNSSFTIYNRAKKANEEETFLMSDNLLDSYFTKRFFPAIFGDPTFSNFGEILEKSSALDLYLIIETFLQYYISIKDRTWQDKQYDMSTINECYEIAMKALKEFLKIPGEFSGSEGVIHTKEYYDWYHTSKENFWSGNQKKYYLKLSK